MSFYAPLPQMRQIVPIFATSKNTKSGWHRFVMMPAQFLIRVIRAIRCLERSVAHATRCTNRRQEGRERGYYYLHRNLYNPLLHNFRCFFLTTNYANFTNLYCAQQIIRLIRAIRGFNLSV